MSFFSFNNSQSVILQEYTKKCNFGLTVVVVVVVVVVVAMVDLFILGPSQYFGDILKYSEWLATEHLSDFQFCLVVEVGILYSAGPETTGTFFSIFTACFSFKETIPRNNVYDIVPLLKLSKINV